MPKITAKQEQEINNKCKNDWKLDTEFYLNYNEKTLIKQVRTDDEHYLEFALRYNHQKQISLHISNFEHKKGENFSSTHGIGKWTILDNTKYSRKNINNLIMITSRLTDEELLKINAETKVSESDGLFLQSEEF